MPTSTAASSVRSVPGLSLALEDSTTSQSADATQPPSVDDVTSPSDEAELSAFSLSRIEPIPSTSGLHSVTQKGSAHVPHAEPEDRFNKENDANDAVNSDDGGNGHNDDDDEDDDDNDNDGSDLRNGEHRNAEASAEEVKPVEGAVPEPNILSTAKQKEEIGKRLGLESVGKEDDDDMPANGVSSADHSTPSKVGEKPILSETSYEDDEDEEDDEEEEPTLKYSRLGGETSGIVAKDSVSALTVSLKFIALGTHNGAIFVLDFHGAIVKRFRPHSAMINDLSIDSGSDFVASASMDGQIAIHALVGTDPPHVYDARRPMHCVALEPHFGKRSTRQFVSGGMAGVLTLHEKGWLGHKEVILHSDEGPIWATEWRGNFIAWANDAGVRIYDTASGQRITYISRAGDSPRADLFKCTLHWQDDRTLLIAWADYIKVAVVREREGKRANLGVGPHITELYVEVTAIFQLDCMISGIAPYKDSYLILAYVTEELYENEATEDRDQQRRRSGIRPELRLISKDGEELSSDAISLRNYDRFQCRDYSLSAAPMDDHYYVISPQDIVVAEPRDESDHIGWLIEQRQYEPALVALEKAGLGKAGGYDVAEVGQKFLAMLVEGEEYEKAAEKMPKILGINAKWWEDWVFLYADKGRIAAIVPYVPTHDPQLSRMVYEMILAHYLRHDNDALLRTIKAWPQDIYDMNAVILYVRDRLNRYPSSRVLMESICELYIRNRQPGKAIPYFLKLGRREVFDLIRDHNLFTDVQDQALHLVEFDEESRESEELKTESSKAREELIEDNHEGHERQKHGTAIALLVDHTNSIPIPRVVAQLQSKRKYLFMYLDALFDKDPHLAFDYSDLQVDLYAEFNVSKLMDFLRASNYYSLERALEVCSKRDLVPEMVFLLGRMGDNKRALNLIIERLGDVQRAIEFAKEQDDDDLWEDLLKYAETKPLFIRGLLENVGSGIDPIRLIRRIKNGLEIPGLKMALTKILRDYNLQVSVMEGCKTILYSDARDLAISLHKRQTNGFLWTGETIDGETHLPIYPQLAPGGTLPPMIPIGVHYLCGDTYTTDTAFSPYHKSGHYAALETTPTTFLAVSLLKEMSNSDVSTNNNSTTTSGSSYEDHEYQKRAKAMNSKLRLVADLKASHAGRKSSGGRRSSISSQRESERGHRGGVTIPGDDSSEGTEGLTSTHLNHNHADGSCPLCSKALDIATIA